MRPKVIHVVVTGSVGGAETSLVALASRPEATDADHCIALFTQNPKVRALFLDARLNVHDRGQVSGSPIGYLRRTFGPTDLEWLANVVRKENATCVNAHTFATHLLAARLGLKCQLPVVRSEADYMHYTNPTCALYRRWALRNTTMIIANSDYVRRFVATFEPAIAGRIQVIYKGLDLNRFAAMPPPAGRPFTFAIVARLVPLKQVHLAIEALARVGEARMNVVGDGQELENLMVFARTRGIRSRVEFHGYQTDPQKIIADSHAIVSCSRYEALGRSIVEAAALRRPAVAFPVGGVPEIVRDGETGWLTRDMSVEALAGAMAEAARNPQEAAMRGENARALVERNFSIERMGIEYGRVYKELSHSSTDVAKRVLEQSDSIVI